MNTLRILLDVCAFYELTQGTITFDLLLNDTWKDPRLAFKQENNSAREFLVCPEDAAKKIWVPDLHFPVHSHYFLSQPNRINALRCDWTAEIPTRQCLHAHLPRWHSRSKYKAFFTDNRVFNGLSSLPCRHTKLSSRH